MKKVYIDKDFKCYITEKEGTREIATNLFDGMCDAYIEGHRLVPKDEKWTREDGVEFEGEMAAPFVDTSVLRVHQVDDEKSALFHAGLIGTETPSLIAAATRLTMDRVCQTIDDKDAYNFYELYPIWQEGIDYKAETVEHKADRVRYMDEDCLYKCMQDHTSQGQWNPLDAPTLWTRIDETHKGTKDDPIPAGLNMIYYKDLYYTEEQGLFLCIRDSVIELQYLPHDLVGIYFKKAE